MNERYAHLLKQQDQYLRLIQPAWEILSYLRGLGAKDQKTALRVLRITLDTLDELPQITEEIAKIEAEMKAMNQNQGDTP